MKPIAKRRTFGICLTVFFALALLIADVIGKGTVRHSGHLSGWGLLGLIVFLALYNVRKAVPYLRLGSSANWLQFHIYCGLLSSVVFAIHVRFSIPNGIFECCLAFTYLLVFVSGLVGLYMSRTYPTRLTHLGNEVIFEQIPVVRRQLKDQVEILALSCNSEVATSAIPEFYRLQIRPFMLNQFNVFAHLMRRSNLQYHSLRRAFADQHRYLNEAERVVLTQMESLVTRKHQLDAQFALQAALKIWLFVHIPGTYALLIFAFFHSVLVHAWFGGLS